ncbi:MAG: ATPase [Synergistales bacterium]|nr:ATPase [Synergistales bacterium]
MTEEATKKVEGLRELIFAKAEAEKGAALQNARREARQWVAEQTEQLEQTIAGISRDAGKRAGEIRRREVMAAERESERERLRLQNRLLADAMNRLASALEGLRDRRDYPAVLAGIALEGIESMPSVSSVVLQLAERDQGLGGAVVERLRRLAPDVELSFDPTPAPITGGVWLRSGDGRWRSRLDWGILASEMADTLAERLLL